VKSHFLGYILNGMTDAYRIVRDERLLRMANRLAEFVAQNFYYRQVVPYCVNSDHPADQFEMDSPVIDPATGLFKLYQITREAWQLDIALKLWWHSYTWQVECPERPELHGAIVQGHNPRAAELSRGEVHASRHPVFNPNKTGHVCIYYHNQYVLSSRELLGLLAK